MMALIAMFRCGGDSNGVVVVQRPGITQTSPQDGAVNTNLNPRIQVWFDESLNEVTVMS